jgi:hypothetical protein
MAKSLLATTRRSAASNAGRWVAPAVAVDTITTTAARHRSRPSRISAAKARLARGTGRVRLKQMPEDRHVRGMIGIIRMGCVKQAYGRVDLVRVRTREARKALARRSRTATFSAVQAPEESRLQLEAWADTNGPMEKPGIS